MILQSLYRYYETLCAMGKLSKPGWDANFKVSFGMDLSADGEILDLLEFRNYEIHGEKETLVPRKMNVPAHAVRTVGITANFLCDNASYMLGIDEKGKPERTARCLQANSELHHRLLDGINSPAAKAVLAYFDTWDPKQAKDYPCLASHWDDLMGNSNLIFCYNGLPVAEDPEIADAWTRYYESTDPDAVTGQCLITGEVDTIAATHPQIKGVRDSQSSGAALVSFNAPAFCSYGHEQNYNAPVSKKAAFGYTSALNYLLADRDHCQHIGDTTVVCWADHGGESYQDAAMAAMFGESSGVSDEDLAYFLKCLVEGKSMDWGEVHLNPNEHFYVLGLAPNAARLSVRFFLQDNFGDFLRNIAKHYEDIAIIHTKKDRYEFLPLWVLLNETVNEKSKDKAASPQLAGDTLRSILTGAPYPSTLLNAVELRISAERDISRGKAAIIKGYYTRQKNIPFPREVLQMELNTSSTDIPYTLGRLFYVLEWIQTEANPTLNTTIKDKYFSSASSTPATIFPSLINLAQNHLKKIRQSDNRYNTAGRLEKKMEEYMGLIGERFPARLTLPERGAFQLGYYFERQHRYIRKSDENKKEELSHVRTH